MQNGRMNKIILMKMPPLKTTPVTLLRVKAQVETCSLIQKAAEKKTSQVTLIESFVIEISFLQKTAKKVQNGAMNKIILMKTFPLKTLKMKPMILLRTKTQVETLIKRVIKSSQRNPKKKSKQ